MNEAIFVTLLAGGVLGLICLAEIIDTLHKIEKAVRPKHN